MFSLIKYTFILMLLFFLPGLKYAISADYNSLLLRTQASIFPKIILLDQDIQNKLNDNTILFSIIYDISDLQAARRFKELIEEQYNHVITDKSLEINLLEFDTVSENNLSTAYYIMQGLPEQHQQTTDFAEKYHRITFSYNYKDFDNNSLISLLIKEKTYIYLNKSAIHSYQIKFLPIFYKIVKVIDE